MRFRAPARDEVAAATFAHPAFSDFAHRDALLNGASWPQIDELNHLLGDRIHRTSQVKLRFAAQTLTMLADGSHYESRIFDTGVIATRAGSWHDLFNALMWLDRFELKCAINAAYVAELHVPKTEPRSRAQCALTHFDEGGAVVVVEDPALLAFWDAHDWRGLFYEGREPWDASTRVMLFGHAMLEQRLVPGTLSVAKCVVLDADTSLSDAVLMAAIAEEITAGRLLRDPQDLRPLPLAGLTNWHADNRDEAFYRDMPCFRPLRPDRHYPPALTLDFEIIRSRGNPHA
ncbi:MAG: DUF3025 domain-containing protein [Gammaproteobacteria bacterium]|nr:DUF3025 domain-containing protein [Gammaproteobacteria bacterium]